jgi:cobalt-zinc-cadmium resistance protein CzcA
MAGVLLVSALNRELYSSPLTLRASVQKVAVQQFRAILMMLVVAIIGLIPAATSSGIGSDVQRPLATVIIGGLTFTLLFTPVVIPPLYYWIERKSKSHADARPS